METLQALMSQEANVINSCSSSQGYMPVSPYKVGSTYFGEIILSFLYIVKLAFPDSYGSVSSLRMTTIYLPL